MLILKILATLAFIFALIINATIVWFVISKRQKQKRLLKEYIEKNEK